MTKRIGIDLDNTILEYRAVFRDLALERHWVHENCPAEKAVIKKQLIEVAGNVEEGEIRWQLLQAAVYGDQIGRALILEGFLEFIKAMRQNGHDLYIVSHKSETSHIDPSVNLREWALTTLTERGFFDPIEQGGLGFSPEKIFFESTRNAKVARIQKLRLGWFIDDMSLVLRHEGFPENTQPLLIGEEKSEEVPYFDNWSQIQNYFEIEAALPQAYQKNLVSMKTIHKGGNNRLSKWTFEDNSQLIVKNFLVDDRDKRPRREQEWRFLRFLWDHDLQCIPKPVETLSNANIVLCVDGRPPESNDVGIEKQMATFLVALDRIGMETRDQEAIGQAADARFTLGDHLQAIHCRQDIIEKACRSGGYPEILEFLNNELNNLHIRGMVQFEIACQEADMDPDKQLPRELWYPSPSDFGLHNCLITAQNQLIFMDFEYAGWDDPAKLLCDFLRHVGNDLPVAQRLTVIRNFVSARPHDPNLWDRFRALADLNAVEWILIVLNVVARHEARRKQFAGASDDHEALINQRFQKAKTLCDQFWSIQPKLCDSEWMS